MQPADAHAHARSRASARTPPKPLKVLRKHHTHTPAARSPDRPRLLIHWPPGVRSILAVRDVAWLAIRASKAEGRERERSRGWRMPRDSTTLTFVIVGEETPIYECEIKAGAKVSEGLRGRPMGARLTLFPLTLSALSALSAGGDRELPSRVRAARLPGQHRRGDMDHAVVLFEASGSVL